MLNSKQRAKLRGMASKMEAVVILGKGGITENIIKSTDDALTARELIKGSALETCSEGAREAAEELAKSTGADVVQVIGSRFVLYRANPEKPVIAL